MSDLEPMMMPTRGASTSSSANSASAWTWVLGGAGSDIGDVPAQLATVELDHVRGSIRGAPGGTGVVPERGDIEDASARRDDLAVALGRARVDDLHVGGHGVEPADHVARGGGRRVAAGRQHDRDRRARVPLELEAVEAARVDGALQRVQQVRA